MVSPFAKVRVSKDEIDLSEFSFLVNCKCSYCFTGLGVGANFLTYRIGDTSFYVDWMPGTISYWDGCPNSFGAKPVLFEELFEEVPEDIKECLIYHLDIFSN
jgi:hypothetical protein